MSTLGLDVTGNGSDADSDFDDGTSDTKDHGDEESKRRPRVRRAEDMEEESHEEHSEVQNVGQANNQLPDLQDTPAAEPATGRGRGSGRGGRARGLKSGVSTQTNDSKPSESRGHGGSRGRGERGRGNAERGRGRPDKSRGVHVSGGGDKRKDNGVRGDPGGDSTPSNAPEAAQGNTKALKKDKKGQGKHELNTEQNEGVPDGWGAAGQDAGWGVTPSAAEQDAAWGIAPTAAEQDAAWGIEPTEAENDNVRSEKPAKSKNVKKPQKTTESKAKTTENTAASISLKEPQSASVATSNGTVLGAEALIDAGWGVDASADAGWGVDASADAGRGMTTATEDVPDKAGAYPTNTYANASGSKHFRRPPLYVNPDRVKTGGVERTKLTDEELAARMEKARLRNQKIIQKREEVAQDEQQFAAEQAAAKARAEAQAKIQNDINHERQKIAEKKIAQAEQREWDFGKLEKSTSVQNLSRGVAEDAVGEGAGDEVAELHKPPPRTEAPASEPPETLFGRTVTPAERLRQHQRSLAKAQRELDRERTKLEQQEKKLVADIKKSAKAGQMNACKVMAKDLVRTRRYVQKFYQMRTQLQAVGLRIQTLRSNQQMADAMRGATRAMASMNRGMNLPQIQRIMNEFEKESAMMDMKEEMMSDAVDGVMEDDEEDEEVEGDKILQQVLEEIGIDVSQQLGEAPTVLHSTATPLENKKQAVALGGDVAPTGGDGGVTSAEEEALQERLNRLRGP